MVPLLCVLLWFFSKIGTALCVRILNATAKFDSLLENLVRFGSSSLAILLLDGFETRWATFHYTTFTGLLLDGYSLQSNQFYQVRAPLLDFGQVLLFGCGGVLSHTSCQNHALPGFLSPEKPNQCNVMVFAHQPLYTRVILSHYLRLPLSDDRAPSAPPYLLSLLQLRIQTPLNQLEIWWEL